jgi:hypothetical protein
MNKKSYEDLAGQLGPISIETAKLSAKLGSASPEEMQELVESLGKLEIRKKGILVALTLMREDEREERRAERKAAEDDCRNLVEKSFAKIEAKAARHKILCPKCGSSAKIVDSPPQPSGYSQSFWTNPDQPWFVEMTCENPNRVACGLRFRITPDSGESADE